MVRAVNKPVWATFDWLGLYLVFNHIARTRPRLWATLPWPLAFCDHAVEEPATGIAITTAEGKR